jgi:putative toxin-antitoxin system antitoxin component (TIGR02293 family)
MDSAGLSLKQLAHSLDLSPRSLQRRRQQGRLAQYESDRLYRLARIVALAKHNIGDAQAAARWLKRPNRALGGGIPLDLVDTEVGARAVEDVLGRIAYGGALSHSAGHTEVIPQDGVGRRFHLIDAHHRIHVELERDGFAPDKPIRFDDNLQQLTFVVENRDPQPAKPHTTQVKISGLQSAYDISADGKSLARIPIEGGTVALPIGEQGATITIKRSQTAASVRGQAAKK